MHAGPQGVLVRLVHSRCLDHPGIRYLPGTRVLRLECDDGRVSGVLAERRSAPGTPGTPVALSARRGVVLASGGFTRDRRLLETFAPRWADAVSLSGPDTRGDGLRMAWALGAQVADMAYVEASFGASIPRFPDLRPDPDDRPRLLYPSSQGAIVVNRRGERFVDESLNYKVVSGMCARQPDGMGSQPSTRTPQYVVVRALRQGKA